MKIQYAPIPFVGSKEYVDVIEIREINGRKFSFCIRYKSEEPISMILEHFNAMFEKACEMKYIKRFSHANP